MSKIKWDETGTRLFELGVKNCVHYLYDSENNKYTSGKAWNGITEAAEKPEGADPNNMWADNMKYAVLRGAEEFKGSINAYTYPDQFAECDGSKAIVPGVFVYGQERKMFGICFRTDVGNDVDGSAHGYKIHLWYGLTVSPSERTYETVNDSPEAINFSWEVESSPIEVPGFRPVSTIVIDSNSADKDKLKALMDKLYGTESTEPEMPMPEEVFEMMGYQKVA